MIGILVVVLLALVWTQTLKFGFLSWDDNMQITANPNVTHLTSETIKHNFEQERFTFIPLTCYSVLYSLWGNNPLPFRAMNLLLHVLNVVLVLVLLRQFVKNNFVLVLIIVLFALHPQRVESVAWISETKGLMMAFFSLLAFVFYSQYLKNTTKRLYLAATFIMAIGASLSKVPGLMVPLSLFVFDYLAERKFSLISILEKILILAAVIFINFPLVPAVSLILSMAMPHIEKKLFSVNRKIIWLISFGILILIAYFIVPELSKLNLSYWRDLPENRFVFTFSERFLLAGAALWLYIRYFFVPFPLNAVYPYPVKIDGTLPAYFYLFLIVLVAVVIISFLLIYYRKKLPKLLLAGWFFFLINISVFLHLIPIEGRVIAADRYSYLPGLGLALLVAVLFEKYLFSKVHKAISVTLLVFLVAITTLSSYSRTKTWRDSKTLFTDVLQKNPDISFAYTLIAGDFLARQHADSAIVCLNKAIELDPDDLSARYNRGLANMAALRPDSALNDFNSFLKLTQNPRHHALAYTQIGEIYRNAAADSLALHYFNKALQNDTSLALAYNRRGVVYLSRNNPQMACADFQLATRYNPYYAEAWNNLGFSQLQMGKTDEAILCYNKAILLNPTYYQAYGNRAFAMQQKGDIEAAIADFNEEIRLNPGGLEAYVNRGRAYASRKSYTQAIADFTGVIEKNPNHLPALTNRAYAYFYSGDTLHAKADFIALTGVAAADASVWLNLAWFYMQTDQPGQSVLCIDRAVAIAPLQTDNYINAGWICLSKQQWKLAGNYALKALDINKSDSDALYLLAEVYRLSDKLPQACEYYHKASEMGNKKAEESITKYCKP
ncbi:MAG: tetratricopeptide repeat protein [Bacteroidales bacterium]|nr:tetratricopeptide repeat protein [Bacteroidales bacterium]